jgi:dipeptidyl aminopeptidase/acylaminoacyl peptidase
MLPRQSTQKGLFYVSFRTPLPSIFRLDGQALDTLLKQPPARGRKASRRARKPRKVARQGRHKRRSERSAVAAPPAFSTSTSLQFRTAAQNLHGQIAATINDGQQADVWLLGKDGQPRENLTKDDSDDLDPSWSPDGTKLAFVSDRSGSPQVYVLNLGDRSLRRLTFAGRYNTGPDWGYDGKIVYSGLRGRAVDILTVDMHKSIQRLTPGKGRRSLEPSWSPCGRRVLYVSDEDKKGTRLWIASHDGAVRQPLALPGGRYYTPIWRRSPDQAPEPFQP